MVGISLSRLSRRVYKLVKAASPVDTGNLRDHGITLEKTGRNEWTVSIGAPGAPYAVYTNEVWVAPRWNGKPNPNEHWIDEAVVEAVSAIMSATGGKLASATGVEDRFNNKSYWDSPEGQKRLKEYQIDDIQRIVSRNPTTPT